MWADVTAALRDGCARELAGGAAEGQAQEEPSRDENKDQEERNRVECAGGNSGKQCALPADRHRVALASHFSLHDTMSALGLGDARMDAGLRCAAVPDLTARLEVCEGDSGDVLPVPDAAKLSEDAVCAVMDRLFALFASWLEGNMISQTLWTCLYAQNPQALLRVQNRPLYAFVVVLLKLIDAMRNAIIRAAINNEEDVSPNSCGMDLAEGIKVEEASGTLDEVLAELSSSAIRRRLETLATLYRHALDLERLPATAGVADLGRVCTGFEAAAGLLREIISAEDDDGARVPEGIFDPALVYRANSAMPLGPVQPESVAVGLTQLLHTINGLSDLRLLAECQTLAHFERLFDRFAAAGQNVVVMSYLYLLFLRPEAPREGSGDNNGDVGDAHGSVVAKAKRDHRRLYVFGETRLFALIGGDVRDFWLAGENFAVSQRPSDGAIADFAQGFEAFFVDWFQTMCKNSARQRRLLSKLLMTHFGEAALAKCYELDGDNTTGFLTHWMSDRIAVLQIRILQLGFALELYSLQEIATTFWYLEFLFGHRMNVLALVRKHCGRVVVPAKNARLLEYREFEFAAIAAQKELVQGLFRWWRALWHCADEFVASRSPPSQSAPAAVDDVEAGIPRSFPLGSDFLRYYQRFGMFSAIRQPEILPFFVYVDNAGVTNPEVVQMLQDSAARFGDAKKQLEAALQKPHDDGPLGTHSDFSQASLRQLMKVCVLHGVLFVRTISGLAVSKNPDFVEIGRLTRTSVADTATHRFFPVMTFRQ
jgi:Mak10 subunit, NatC N(alpha)-terminal acetyltransferase